MNRVGAIVLAAGGSRRFGSSKQLVRLDGRSLVRRAADAALAAGFRPTLVVLGSNAAEIAAELASVPVDLVVHAGWEEGMGSSLRTGVRRLRVIAPDCRAAMVLLADQRLVTETVLRSLTERFEKGPERAAACRYDGIVGPPAIFDSSLFDRLESLRGDEGARSLLRSGDWPVAEIDFPAGARDVDEPADA